MIMERKAVRFVYANSPYIAGDIAVFGVEKANQIIKSGKAVAYIEQEGLIDGADLPVEAVSDEAHASEAAEVEDPSVQPKKARKRKKTRNRMINTDNRT
jgi:hypothetical protein